MLSLPTLQVPGYPKATTAETVVDPGDVYIWQQDVAMVKKQIVQFEENKKHAYALVIEQCSPNLDSKLQRSAAFDDVRPTQRMWSISRPCWLAWSRRMEEHTVAN
jgi:hypothetical protein